MGCLPEFKSCSIGTSLNEKCKRSIEDLKDIDAVVVWRIYHPFMTIMNKFTLGTNF